MIAKCTCDATVEDQAGVVDVACPGKVQVLCGEGRAKVSDEIAASIWADTAIRLTWITTRNDRDLRQGRTEHRHSPSGTHPSKAQAMPSSCSPRNRVPQHCQRRIRIVTGTVRHCKKVSAANTAFTRVCDNAVWPLPKYWSATRQFSL
jgi:hypothetical protein